jgi:hypothetical protein
MARKKALNSELFLGVGGVNGDFIAGTTNATRDKSASEEDVTTLVDPELEFEGGIPKTTLTGKGAVTDATSLAELDAAMDARTLLPYVYNSPTGTSETGNCTVTKITETGTAGQNIEFDFTIVRTGA